MFNTFSYILLLFFKEETPFNKNIKIIKIPQKTKQAKTFKNRRGFFAGGPQPDARNNGRANAAETDIYRDDAKNAARFARCSVIKLFIQKSTQKRKENQCSTHMTKNAD